MRGIRSDTVNMDELSADAVNEIAAQLRAHREGQAARERAFMKTFARDFSLAVLLLLRLARWGPSSRPPKPLGTLRRTPFELRYHLRGGCLQGCKAEGPTYG